jgi:hypothetical protein
LRPFLVWGSLTWVFLGKQESKKALAEHGLIGLLGALASMLLLTAFSFVPDDWSACRLSWSGGLLCGYNLYAGDAGPSNEVLSSDRSMVLHSGGSDWIFVPICSSFFARGLVHEFNLYFVPNYFSHLAVGTLFFKSHWIPNMHLDWFIILIGPPTAALSRNNGACGFTRDSFLGITHCSHSPNE